MLIGEFICVFFQFVKAVLANFLIANVDSAIESWKVNVDPIRVFRGLIEEGCILYYLCIHRIIKLVWEPRFIKHLVFVLRKLNFEISSRLGNIFIVEQKIKVAIKKKRTSLGMVKD